MAPLTVVVDDVGSHEHIDGAAVSLMRLHGTAIVASVMVTSLSATQNAHRFAQLAERQRVEISEHTVGLHLNLTEGRTLARNVWSIQKANSRQMLGKSRLWWLCEKKLVQLNHIEAEIRAQLREFRRVFGFYPSRVDGHHHCHVYPMVALALARVASDYTLHQTRAIPNLTAHRRDCVACAYACNRGPGSTRLLLKAGMQGAHALVGLLWCDGVYSLQELESEVAKISQIRKAASVEIMTHCKFGTGEFDVILKFAKKWLPITQSPTATAGACAQGRHVLRRKAWS